jgi:hypothetical protein
VIEKKPRHRPQRHFSERSDLQQLINRHKTAQQLVVRAKIILLASEGKNHGGIVRILDISLDMARLWRNRWFETSDIVLLPDHDDSPYSDTPFSNEE